MSSKGKQRENATSNIDPNKVVETYKELKSIIMKNSNTPFKDIINTIANINVGTFYNYIYPGKQMGQVSLYTVENLSNYFNLPKEVFTCEQDLTEEIKSKIALKISQDFSTKANAANKNVTFLNNLEPNLSKDILSQIKVISMNLNNENSIETLSEAISLLETTLNISKNRLENLIILSKL